MRTLVVAFMLAACGPPLPRSSDGGADRDGGKDGEAADAQATDEPPVTSGSMSATVGGAKFTATTVGARRVAGGRLEVVGTQSKETITIVVPASVGTFTCTDGASVTYRSSASTCTVIVSAVGTRVTGVFSASPEISDGTFSVAIAD